MAGFFQAVALDLDGTLTCDGVLSRTAVDAIDEAREHGLTAILVTGRIRSELDAEFPTLARHFDALVVENGAVAEFRDRVHSLGPRVDEELADALAAAGTAFRLGWVILACGGEHAPLVADEITRLGLDCQVMHNRGELMVTPSGVSKGTGLRAALEELGISAHNTVAVGDAENDLALLEAAEVGVAVANAVPSLCQHADLMLEQPNGEGIARLLRGPLIAGSQIVHPARRGVPIGHTSEGRRVMIPGAQANILVTGTCGAGKSHLAGLLVERWREAGYTVLVIDPEGDHTALGRLHGTVVIDAANAPDVGGLLQMLRQQGLSLVLDLSRLPGATSYPFLRTLAGAITAARAVYGLPHWIVIDEAHGPLGEQGVLADIFRPTERGHCLVTYQPEQLWTPSQTMTDVVLTALGRTTGTGGEPGRATATYRPAGGVQELVVLDHRLTPHIRHRHKYAESLLPSHCHFVFRDERGHVIASAGSVEEFAVRLENAETESVLHHALHGDFSRWVSGTIQDRELGAVLATVENDLMARQSADAEHARQRILAEIGDRYLADDG